MNKNLKIAVIGAGHLGRCILKVLADNGYKNLIATRRDESELKNLKKLNPELENTNLETTTNNKTAVEKADVIILATKNTSFSEISKEVKANFLTKEEEKNQNSTKEKLLISLCPVTNLKTLSQLFGTKNCRLIMPIDPLNDVICYSLSGKCEEKEEKIIQEMFQLFGGKTKKISEDKMPIASTYVLFRGILNSVLDPWRGTGISAGLSPKEAEELLGELLISTGQEFKKGLSAEKRIENASGGYNPKSFTLKLTKDLQPIKDQLAQSFDKTYKLFKEIEEN